MPPSRASRPTKSAGVFEIADDGAAAGKIASVKGMLQLLASAAIHKAFFPTPLAKDQPILLKTSLAKTWVSLVQDGVVGEDTNQKDVAALLCRLLDVNEKEPTAIVRNIVRLVMDGTDPVWGSDKQPVDLDEERAGRKQVVIELRRVPILPISEWTDFAESTYHYFITDKSERFS